MVRERSRVQISPAAPFKSNKFSHLDQRKIHPPVNFCGNRQGTETILQHFSCKTRTAMYCICFLITDMSVVTGSVLYRCIADERKDRCVPLVIVFEPRRPEDALAFMGIDAKAGTCFQPDAEIPATVATITSYLKIKLVSLSTSRPVQLETNSHDQADDIQHYRTTMCQHFIEPQQETGLGPSATPVKSIVPPRGMAGLSPK